jgi:transposase
MAGIAIARAELDAGGLRHAAARCRDAAAARRMPALALVLEGAPRTAAARACGMDRRTLRDWVHRYNAEGLAGLSDRPQRGPRPRLKPEQEAEVAGWVEAGPDLARHGVVRRRRADLRAPIAERFGVELRERSVGELLARLGFRRLSPRPRHPGHDAAARASFGATSPPSRPPPCPRPRRAGPSRSGSRTVGSAASNRVGRQGTPTRLWARRGSRPPAPRDRRYAWAYLFGAVRPARQVGAALVLPHANAGAMRLHLAEIGRHVAPGAHAAVVLDGAGWHRRGGRLRVPASISLLPLPPYAPELDPVENLWQFLRQNQLSNRVFDSYEAIVDACCTAWNALMAVPQRIAPIATRPWAQVKA